MQADSDSEFRGDLPTACRQVGMVEWRTIALVNTQNVSVTKIVDSSSIQCAETKYGLRIQFLALDFTIHEVWLNA